VIQAGSNTLRYEIQKLSNSIWKKEELPQQWKESGVVPRKKCDKTDCSNHRQIPLLASTQELLSNIFPSKLIPLSRNNDRGHQC
jgi:hypothetical protein